VTTFSDFVPLFQTWFDLEMVDTITISRITARGAYNSGTRRHAADTVISVYGPGLKALIRPGFGSNEDKNFAEGENTYGVYDVLVPNDAGSIEPEDKLEVVTSVNSTELVGKIMRVVAVDNDSYEARQVLRCELSQGRGNP
jgi:Family of unknown function (DUF6093)